MTRRALACSIEVGLTGFYISRLKVRDIHPAPSTFLRVAFSLLVVNECNKSRHVAFGQIERRHTVIRPAIANHWTQLLAILILGGELGTREVGSGFAARRIAA